VDSWQGADLSQQVAAILLHFIEAYVFKRNRTCFQVGLILYTLTPNGSISSEKFLSFILIT
jgi:hypothetical protein